MYNLNLEKVAEEIKNSKAKKVLLQLPDGLKPEAEKIIDFVNQKSNAEIFLWFSDCYGACDLPLGTEIFDLIIHFGHNEFVRGW
jgi:2-(3-amino-3-carboxypropyl)histidine synthase